MADTGAGDRDRDELSGDDADHGPAVHVAEPVCAGEHAGEPAACGEQKEDRSGRSPEDRRCCRAGKRDRLDELCDALKIDRHQAMSVGDGANDIDMLQAAGMGVAFHAKPAAAQAARARIDHGDLTALLYIQGYRAGDIGATPLDSVGRLP